MEELRCTFARRRRAECHELCGQREDDRRTSLAGNVQQRAKVAKLHRLRLLRQYLASLQELFRCLQLAFGVDHLGATQALGFRLLGLDVQHVTGFRGRGGEALTFAVTGSTDGRVWGTDLYTDDSDLSTAAVHAGLLAPGESGTVTVLIEGGQPGYEGSTRNGVSIHDLCNAT